MSLQYFYLILMLLLLLLDLALSIIFNEDEGILQFVKKYILENYLQEAIKYSLELLLLLVQDVPLKIKDHSQEISSVRILLCP